MGWWMDKTFRLIQNNLRDIDAQMDIDRQIAWMKRFDANVLMIGGGGITAFYPSKLDCQVVNPYMTGDFLGDVVEKCHANGIRVIARFDFSKTHEQFYGKHPDWYSRTADGEPIRYNDTIATCVNGPYQQACSLEEIREVITNYPVDGIFFNMFGYQTHDYSGHYVGICQCESCKRRFSERYGLPLPTEENEADEAYQKYLEFKEYTVRDILLRINKLVKGINPEVAISTYHPAGVDMIRNESNSAVDRPYPFWLYASALNVSRVEGSFSDKVSCNCAINAVDIPYRFMGVSKYLNQIRLFENIASGSGLDWCIIGSFDDYPDRENFESVETVFRFHARYERYFGHFTSLARILLVNPGMGYGHAANEEFRGLFKLLKEEHRLFAVIDQYALEQSPERLNDYDVVLLPALARVEAPALAKALEETTACVAATGLSLAGQPELLKRLFGLTLGERLEPVRGAYLETTPKSVFTSFAQRDWIYLDKEYRYAQAEAGVDGLLPLVSPAMFGPPERCFGHERSSFSSAYVKDGRRVYFPWMPGTLYHQHGYEDFKYALLNVLDSVRKPRAQFSTNAPKNVEIFFDRIGEGQYLLQLLNLSGFNGTTVYEPVVMQGLTVTLEELHPARVVELAPDGEHALEAGRTIGVDRLEGYKAYLIEV